jgi:hypothetical protein
MGGLGSGRWHKWRFMSTTDNQHSIDIRRLRREGCLWPGHIGGLSWSRNGQSTGSISYRMETDRMVLSYRHQPNGGEWESVEQSVTFDRTPCNYGGSRTWFLCSRCGRRVALLYGSGKYFLCRHCYGLAYMCQLEGRLDRVIRKLRGIRERMGGSPDLFQPLPGRPKHMH